MFGNALGNAAVGGIQHYQQRKAEKESALVSGARDGKAPRSNLEYGSEVLSPDERRKWAAEKAKLLEAQIGLDKAETERREALAKSREKVDSARQELETLQSDLSNSQARIDRARLKLEGANERHIRMQQTLDQSVHAAQKKIADMETAVQWLASIETRASDFMLSNPIMIKGAAGVAEQYQIKGPTGVFASEQLAARDAIAYGFGMEQILGDGWERGGIVDKIDENRYSYSYLTGRVAKSGDGSGLEEHRPYVPLMKVTQNTVSYWHTHPRGTSANVNFSNPGDVNNFVTTARLSATRSNQIRSSYLGGNDFSFDVITFDPATRKGYVIDNGQQGYFDFGKRKR